MQLFGSGVLYMIGYVLYLLMRWTASCKVIKTYVDRFAVLLHTICHCAYQIKHLICCQHIRHGPTVSCFIWQINVSLRNFPETFQSQQKFVIKL